MWIATEHGFYSAVEHRDKPNSVMIRARVREDLEHMVDQMRWGDVTIVDSPAADYPHRVTITKKQWAHFVAEAAAGIDYPNFKTRVGKHDRHRADVYHDVWADLQKLEKGYKTKRWHTAVLDHTLFGDDLDDAFDDDEPWLCPDCDETLIGFQEVCKHCGCKIDWENTTLIA
jgi:Rieske Fe-S protein